jgi:hypothetical protein
MAREKRSRSCIFDTDAVQTASVLQGMRCLCVLRWKEFGVKKAKITFVAFSLLFQPLYFLMVWMYADQLQTEEDPLAQTLDVGIVALGIVYMGMQFRMMLLAGKAEHGPVLKRLFYQGLAVWFFLEVVLSYAWCFVTGANALTEHTPFVLLFAGFLGAQAWALRRLEDA